MDRHSGRAVDIWGNPDHPMTQGTLCTKVDRYLERTYHPDRLTTPLKRIGPKGSGQFVPVSWDVALDGHRRAAPSRSSPSMAPKLCCPIPMPGRWGCSNEKAWRRASFNRMGASRLARTICSEPGCEGYSYTIGAGEGMEPEAYAQAKLILIWGSNTLTSNVHLWNFIQQARKDGGRVIVIDPAATRTARAADEWIPIRPGTDGALALAMMHVIIDEGLHDADYVERYTVGFDQLAERVAEWTPERAAAITGIPADTHPRLGPRLCHHAPRGHPHQLSASNATPAAAWRCAPSPVCPRWSAHGETTAAASN